MLIAEQIAKLIEEMLDENKGEVNLKRNDLALQLGCVPSQISYVISSRFTPQRGYMIESRRGGGGYIRIVRASMSKSGYLMHFFQAVGTSVSEDEARAYISNLLGNRIISEREADIIAGAVSLSSLERIQPDGRNAVRADILRHILMILMR